MSTLARIRPSQVKSVRRFGKFGRTYSGRVLVGERQFRALVNKLKVKTP